MNKEADRTFLRLPHSSYYLSFISLSKHVHLLHLILDVVIQMHLWIIDCLYLGVLLVIVSIDFTHYPNTSYCLSLNFIYYTTITKQVIQLILIMLVGTDMCVRMVFVWEENGVPGGNPPVWLGDQWPSHMPMPGIEPELQRWEASVLTLR